MISINLERADNGIIKSILDDNINGAGGVLEKMTVYELEDDDKNDFLNTIKFFQDLTQDLGLDVGNKFNKNNLILSVDWGTDYSPTKEEVKQRINNLKKEVLTLETLLKS